MPRSFEEVRQIANELPEDQRILLANSLWESIVPAEDEASGCDVAAAWDDEIKRRLTEIDSGAVDLIPWEQLRAEMIESLSPQARARLRDEAITLSSRCQSGDQGRLRLVRQAESTSCRRLL